MTLHESMLAWLHRNGTPEAVEVVNYEESEELYRCGEGTCEYDQIMVKIYYLDATGNEDYDWYEGEFTEFIRELTDAP